MDKNKIEEVKKILKTIRVVESPERLESIAHQICRLFPKTKPLNREVIEPTSRYITLFEKDLENRGILIKKIMSQLFEPCFGTESYHFSPKGYHRFDIKDDKWQDFLKELK